METIRSRLLTPWIAASVLALGLAGACTPAGGGGGTVDVTLQEWAVLPAQSSVSAGSVTFNVTNQGPDDPHELVIIKTDLDHRALPTREDGGVDEDGAGIEMIGEIEEFEPGQTETGTFQLTAGRYVLVCNIVEEEGGAHEAHYAMGMSVSFEVR